MSRPRTPAVPTGTRRRAASRAAPRAAPRSRRPTAATTAAGHGPVSAAGSARRCRRTAPSASASGTQAPTAMTVSQGSSTQHEAGAEDEAQPEAGPRPAADAQPGERGHGERQQVDPVVGLERQPGDDAGDSGRHRAASSLTCRLPVRAAPCRTRPIYRAGPGAAPDGADGPVSDDKSPGPFGPTTFPLAARIDGRCLLGHGLSSRPPRRRSADLREPRRPWFVVPDPVSRPPGRPPSAAASRLNCPRLTAQASVSTRR